MLRTAALAGAALALAACATSRPAPAPDPYAALRTTPARPRARLYADCLAAAVAEGGVESLGRLARFTCRGPAASALFDAMAPFARAHGWSDGGRGGKVETVRASERAWDDQCVSGSAAGPGLTADRRCTLDVNLGPFGEDDRGA